MRLTRFRVSNFKAIDLIEMDDLGDVVVIAGPNGSGKSTIFDALKLWKTMVGSYQKDEFQTWLGEQGFSQNSADLLAAHQRPNDPIEIEASVSFSADEHIYIQEHARVILAFYFFRERAQGSHFTPPVFTIQNLELNEEFIRNKTDIMQKVEAALPEILYILPNQPLTATVKLTTDGKIEVQAPLSLKYVLSMFVPKGIGVFDYYSSQRLYSREGAPSISLDLKTNKVAQGQSNALYNQASKFSGIKNELASDYVTGLIAGQALDEVERDSNLQSSIAELFRLFLPGKSFSGVQPNADGSLSIDVTTATSSHDISELSSGEKELIYGYLRIRSREARNSVILIDEPELHLNPRLASGLIDFYYRHIGKSANNQIWLVTHSDVILRQAIGSRGHKTYHMRAARTYPAGEKQLVELVVDADVNRAFLDLVGDIAAYKPGGALVIVEGAAHSEFDKSVISALFPQFAESVNLVSGESRSKVHAIQAIITRVGQQQSLFNDVKSIVDSDNIDPRGLQPSQYCWDRYNIENYLLNPEFIVSALKDLILPAPALTTQSVSSMLRNAAIGVLEKRVRHDVEQIAYRALRDAINTSTDRNIPFTYRLVSNRVHDTISKIQEKQLHSLSDAGLATFENERRRQYSEDLANGNWEISFNGRDILERFVHDNFTSVGYETLRNTIIAHMSKARYQPLGMARVIRKIAPSIPSI